jgi:hypothetical protein
MKAVRQNVPRGQAMVEFALILPFLAFFLMAIIEIGRAWNIKQVVTDASREGARLAVVYDPSVKYQNVIDEVLIKVKRAGVNPNDVSVSFLGPNGETPASGTPGQYFKLGTGQLTTVRVLYKCNVVSGIAQYCFPILNSVIGVLQSFLRDIGPIGNLKNTTLGAETRMRNE